MARRRRSYRAPRKLTLNRALIFAAIVILLTLSRWWQGENQPQPAPEALAEGVYAVQRAVDGDTLVLANGARIRLIGADTPETVKPNWPVEPFGPEAKQFTERFLTNADGRVRLQFDRQRQDKYGRFLAYVWADSHMLNEELIRAGLAKAELQYPYSSTMKTRFRRAEEEAQSASRGIWSEQPAARP